MKLVYSECMSYDEKKWLVDIVLCFCLMGFLILLDQVTKIFIVKVCEPYHVYKNFFGDLINIRLVYNTGAAFSLGSELTGFLHLFTLLILPIIGLCAIMFFAIRSKDLSVKQRFYIFGILGGGIGNLIDRIFRPEGVVDFIDVKFFGLFGMQRWPTFNVADSIVIIFGFCLLVSIIRSELKQKNNR